MSLSEQILNILPVGVNNAVHRVELSKRYNIHPRELRRLIERLRHSGAVICSDECGYYRPLDDDELRRYVRREEKRINSLELSLKPAREALKRSEGQ